MSACGVLVASSVFTHGCLVYHDITKPLSLVAADHVEAQRECSGWLHDAIEGTIQVLMPTGQAQSSESDLPVFDRFLKRCEELAPLVEGVARGNGYDEGPDEGPEECTEKGSEEGSEEGYDEGSDRGLEEGAEEGSDEGFESALRRVLMRTGRGTSCCWQTVSLQKASLKMRGDRRLIQRGGLELSESRTLF